MELKEMEKRLIELEQDHQMLKKKVVGNGSITDGLEYKVLQTSSELKLVQNTLNKLESNFAKSVERLEKESSERIGKTESIISRLNWVIVLAVVGALVGIVVNRVPFP